MNRWVSVTFRLSDSGFCPYYGNLRVHFNNIKMNYNFSLTRTDAGLMLKESYGNSSVHFTYTLRGRISSRKSLFAKVPLKTACICKSILALAVLVDTTDNWNHPMCVVPPKVAQARKVALSQVVIAGIFTKKLCQCKCTFGVRVTAKLGC